MVYPAFHLHLYCAAVDSEVVSKAACRSSAEHSRPIEASRIGARHTLDGCRRIGRLHSACIFTPPQPYRVFVRFAAEDRQRRPLIAVEARVM
jgi:hypothetical protein